MVLLRCGTCARFQNAIDNNVDGLIASKALAGFWYKILPADANLVSEGAMKVGGLKDP